MSNVDAAEFESFFAALHGYKPFPWQKRLAKRVCIEGCWPKVVDLPTASGKTACIDIALFSLAVRGKDAPRRIFFIVDRRVIVSEAYNRAERIKDGLKNARGGILRAVADRLRNLAGGDEALETYQLRGGAFRDETWVRTPLQPAVVTSTVDQIGSRLLFRGYGVSELTWPIHAGLIGNDSILFLDEAHCSKAFAQTLDGIEKYRGRTWAPESVERPFHFVEMTATPGRATSEDERAGIDQDDRSDNVFRDRLFATKMVRLPDPVKCKKDETGKFVEALVKQALSLAEETDAKRVAILVNRIATAKAVHAELRKLEKQAMLVIGRMRPLDRELQAEDLEPLKAGRERLPDDSLQFVVSTQCLEVGADFDFDVLVSECASIDALQQRFGRLDRLGKFKKAQGAIVSATWQLGTKEGDPIYGAALKNTWEFLRKIGPSGVVNMGIESEPTGHKTVAEFLRDVPEERHSLTLKTEPGPMLLPAHLDALVQTSPRPEQEPDVELFLHGPQRGNPDVYVVWRCDLNDLQRRSWHDVVSLCPPTSAEAMPVPLWTFKKWFKGEPKREALSDEADIEIAAHVDENEDENGEETSPEALIWRGKDELTKQRPTAEDFHPGDTVVLPESTQSWNLLGYVPPGYRIDLGDMARLQLRRGLTVRLHPKVMEEWWDAESRAALDELLRGEEIDESAFRETLRSLQCPLELRSSNGKSWWNNFVTYSTLSPYPTGSGWVLEGYFGREKKRKDAPLLGDHLEEVASAVDGIVGDLLPADMKAALKVAAQYHDYGKVDVRYQTWLRNGDRMAAAMAPKQLAKSGMNVLKKQKDCGLPEGFRHEILSLQFAEKSPDVQHKLRDLILHIIASHHGCCRPLAPVAIDEKPPCVAFHGLEVCEQERVDNPPHRIGSGVSDRFWTLTREYGWWGLAYLEAMLRLADWLASDKRGVEVTQ